MNCGLKPLDFILTHFMNCTALIAYSVSVVVYTNRIQSAQNRVTFCADAYDGIHAITAEGIFSFCHRMLPPADIMNFMAYVAFFHLWFLIPEDFCYYNILILFIIL